MDICNASIEVPAASAGQPKGVPGAVVWIYVRVPPYVPAEDEVVGAGLAVADAGATVVVDIGLAVVAGAAEVVDMVGCRVCEAGVVGAVVLDGELQPTINDAHKTMRHKGIINFFTLELLLLTGFSLIKRVFEQIHL